MADQPRVVRVLGALLLSMTVGAVVLMILGNDPPSAGPFCLSSYYRLDPVEKALRSRACQSPNRWDCIEIYYSGTDTGNLTDLAAVSGLATPAQLNCHFIICNGRGGDNGQIESTDKWQHQWSVVPGGNWWGTAQTIRICLIANGRDVRPTDAQLKRLEVLVNGLCRRFRVAPDAIYYPGREP